MSLAMPVSLRLASATGRAQGEMLHEYLGG